SDRARVVVLRPTATAPYSQPRTTVEQETTIPRLADPRSSRLMPAARLLAPCDRRFSASAIAGSSRKGGQGAASGRAPHRPFTSPRHLRRAPWHTHLSVRWYAVRSSFPFQPR